MTEPTCRSRRPPPSLPRYGTTARPRGGRNVPAAHPGPALSTRQRYPGNPRTTHTSQYRPYDRTSNGRDHPPTFASDRYCRTPIPATNACTNRCTRLNHTAYCPPACEVAPSLPHLPYTGSSGPRSPTTYSHTHQRHRSRLHTRSPHHSACSAPSRGVAPSPPLPPPDDPESSPEFHHQTPQDPSRAQLPSAPGLLRARGGAAPPSPNCWSTSVPSTLTKVNHHSPSAPLEPPTAPPYRPSGPHTPGGSFSPTDLPHRIIGGLA
jgi:hypothetical protein